MPELKIRGGKNVDDSIHTAGEMAIMGREGHKVVPWSTESEEEVDAARKTFEDLVARGFRAWSSSNTQQGSSESDAKAITEFDETAERIILAPPMAGGSPLKLAVSDAEIDEVLNWAAEGVDQGTRYSGMSYEQGVDTALRWVTGQSDERPDAE